MVSIINNLNIYNIPTVKECNDAYGGNYMTESEVAEAISDATANFLTSSDFQMSFGAASGYIKFPNGFMIQAGHGGRQTTDRQSLSFYTPFPTKCVAVVVSGEGEPGTGEGNMQGVGIKAKGAGKTGRI